MASINGVDLTEVSTGSAVTSWFVSVLILKKYGKVRLQQSCVSQDDIEYPSPTLAKRVPAS